MFDEELDDIEEICAAATPGPWHVRVVDDDEAMNLIAVSTLDYVGPVQRWPNFDNGAIVAATLVQHPRYVNSSDEKWEENAIFIAAARDALPRLVAEVRRLRAALATGSEGRSGE